MPATCEIAPSGPGTRAWAELVAPLANMAEAALACAAPAAAGDAVTEVSGRDPRRAEGDGLAPGAHGGRLCPPVDPDAGPRAHRVHRPAVRARRAGCPAGLGSRGYRGDRRRPGPVGAQR